MRGFYLFFKSHLLALFCCFIPEDRGPVSVAWSDCYHCLMADLLGFIDFPSQTKGEGDIVHYPCPYQAGVLEIEDMYVHGHLRVSAQPQDILNLIWNHWCICCLIVFC